jgi:hypothetical protein
LFVLRTSSCHVPEVIHRNPVFRHHVRELLIPGSMAMEKGAVQAVVTQPRLTPWRGCDQSLRHNLWTARRACRRGER